MNETPEMNPRVDVYGLNRFYSKVYAFLAMGILLSGGVAYAAVNVFPELTISFLMNFPLGFVGLWLVQLGLVLVIGRKGMSNPSLALGFFIAYSILMGITLSITFMLYTQASIARAFVTAGSMFIGLSAFGIMTRKDLSGIGRACYSALIGVIIAILLNAFVLHSTPADYLISFLTIIIFSGLTAYDNQKIRTIYIESNGTAGEGVAIYLALQLYLDFINLFLALLRIFGRNN